MLQMGAAWAPKLHNQLATGVIPPVKLKELIKYLRGFIQLKDELIISPTIA